ncbi:MAG: asparagine synthase C-terminal domain-containing protein [Thermoplasmata archaeon]|jgi:asparagine synthase (glutamine-hydrolysing)
MEPRRAEERTLREGLSGAFEEALRPIRAPAGPLGVLFSGGVDSSLLAWELRRRPELSLCTIGRSGAPDLVAGRASAEQLGLPWEGILIGEAELASAEVRFSGELDGLPIVSRTVLLALALAVERASPPSLVCGQGVDELFLGYAHYRGLGGAEAERRSLEDLERLHGTDWPRTQRIAEKAGKTILAPYLSSGFEECARRVPVDLRLPQDLPKRFFREWAVDRGLPAELAFRPKKALQYGSGVSSLFRERQRAGR